ncbi:MAG: hypothetical protein GQ535_02985 [Rhodobacteraceae bacterium]|nr:hypothetical protein [Paracoccaceae bacterium]
MPSLLLTRARAQGEAFAEQVRANTSLEPIISPMQEMRDLEVKIDLSGISTLAFTSRNGVEAFARISSRRLPAYCVGEATAARARALGFEAKVAAGTAEALKAMLPKTGVLHLHGRHVRQVLGAQHLAIYDQVALPLSDEAQSLLAAGNLNAVALFSPRSAEILAESLPEDTFTKLVLYTLSEAVAAACPAGNSVHICATPSAADMLRLLSADFPA